MNLIGKLTHAALDNELWDDNGIDTGEDSSSEFEAFDLEATDDDYSDEVDSDDVSREGRTAAKHGKKAQSTRSRVAKTRVRSLKGVKSGTSGSVAVDPSAIKAELVNLRATDDAINNQLQDTDVNNDNVLNNGPLSNDQKKVCQALWGQYMAAVNWLANDWSVRPSRILAEGGAVMPGAPPRSENLWNAFLHSEREDRQEGGTWLIIYNEHLKNT